MVSGLSFATSLPVLAERSEIRVRHCSVNTELIDGNNGAKRNITSTVCGSAQKCTDKFPRPSLFEVPRSKATRSTQYGMSAFAKVEQHVQRHHTILHSACTSRTISFLIQAREMTNVLARTFFAYPATVMEFSIHNSLFSLPHHTM